MNDHELSDLLERTGARFAVGPPPTQRMHARVHRRRRHRLAAVALVAASAVGVTSYLAVDHDDRHLTAVDPSTPTPLPTRTAPQMPTQSPSGTPTAGSLAGTWTVTALVGPDRRSVLPAEAKGRVHLTFAAGVLRGTDGCNDLFGTYQRKGTDISFPPDKLGQTLVGCAGEPPLLSRLQGVRHVSGDGDVRYLHATDWMIIAALHRDPLRVGTAPTSPRKTK